MPVTTEISEILVFTKIINVGSYKLLGYFDFFLFQTKYIIKFWKTKQIYYQTISHIGFNGTKYLMLRIMLFF